MADRDVWRKNIPEDFDGRFGDTFDAEVGTRGVIELTLGVAVACVIGMVITWWMLGANERHVEDNAPALLPIEQANEQELPVGPLLQADPEAELEALRHEMATRLNGFGWVDQASGTVHIPIANAIELLAVEPTPEAATASTVTEDPAATEADDASDADASEATPDGDEDHGGDDGAGSHGEAEA